MGKKRKKSLQERQIGVDSFGSPIYKRDVCTCEHLPEKHDSKGNCTIEQCLCEGNYHHSSSCLPVFSICEHYCPGHFKDWSHKVEPNGVCHLPLYASCEDCITFGLMVTKEEKLSMMTDSQRAIIKAWKETQQKVKK